MATHTRESLEELKVADLKKLADKADLEGYSKLKKAELVDALLKVEVEAPAARPTVPAGSIDPVLAARREERLAARGEIPGRVRPTPAGIDPRLVEQRNAQREADKARNAPRSATLPPVRG